MKDIDLIHFEHLKREIQNHFLLKHTPTSEKISDWKGLDIIYFQEDLRKKTKGTISEKSFYNYFKKTSTEKLPRIDMLNILSKYVDYDSWSDFKKNHDNAEKINSEQNEISSEESLIDENNDTELNILQKTNTDNQLNNLITTNIKKESKITLNQKKHSIIWVSLSVTLFCIVGVLLFKDDLFSKKYTFTFIDSDRNSKIQDVLSVRILKDNESPIMFKVKPNSPFVYITKSKTLKMVVSSPFYKTDTIYRNLQDTSENESIELKPNDYAIMLFYYSKSIQDLKQKRRQLNRLINDDALIYQVYDNTTYGVETLDKNTYINLVTTPTTSLKNLEVIDTKMNNNKITLIKFRIKSDEDNQ